MLSRGATSSGGSPRVPQDSTHIARREKTKAEALARGEKPPFDNSIGRFAQAGSDREPADCEISLSIVAIHTTTHLLSSTLIHIDQHSELLPPLREEVVRVLSSEGLKKTALYELRLMDSVFKETQRLKPILLGECGSELYPNRLLTTIQVGNRWL
jgi:cytochrome P450